MGFKIIEEESPKGFKVVEEFEDEAVEETPDERRERVKTGAMDTLLGIINQKADFDVATGIYEDIPLTEKLKKAATDSFLTKPGQIGMEKVLSRNNPELVDANRKAKVYERWYPQIWEAQETMEQLPKNSPEYQAVYEHMRKLQNNFVLDERGEYFGDDIDISMSEIIDAVGDRPGYFMGQLARGIALDPEIAFIGAGWTKPVQAAAAIAKTAKAGRATATAAELVAGTTGVTAATVGTGLAIRTLDQATKHPNAPLDTEALWEGAELDAKIGVGLSLVPGMPMILGRYANYRDDVRRLASEQAARTTPIKRGDGLKDTNSIAEDLSTSLGIKMKKADDAVPVPNKTKKEMQAQIKELAVTRDEVGELFAAAKAHGKKQSQVAATPEKAQAGELKTKTDVENLFTAALASKKVKPVPPTKQDLEVESAYAQVDQQRAESINRAWDLDDQLKTITKKKADSTVADLSKVETEPVEKVIERALKKYSTTETKTDMQLALESAITKEGKASDLATKTAANNVLRKQRGSLTIKQQVGLAAIAGGGLLGYSQEGDIGDAAGAAILTGGGLLAGNLLLRGARGTQNVFNRVADSIEKRNFKMVDFIDEFDGNEASFSLAVNRFNEQLKLVLTKDELLDVAPFIQGTRTDVSDNVRVAAGAVKQRLDDIFTLAHQEGVINSYIDNFIPGLYRPRDWTAAQSFFMEKGLGAGTGTRHNMQKFYQTIEDAKAAGLVPITEDITEILATYSKSVGRAINNKLAVQRLEGSVTPTGAPLVIGRKKVPTGLEKDYVEFKHNAFRDKHGAFKMVHKDAANTLELAFDTYQPGRAVEGLKMVNFMLKRNLVSMSLFHAKALLESTAMALNPFAAGKSTLQLMKEMKKRGSHPALEALYYGQAGDEVDKFVRAGLSVQRIEDVGGDQFKVLMKQFDDSLDKKGIFGKSFNRVAFRPYRKLMEKVDVLMWDKVMTANKILAAMKTFEKIKVRNLELNQRGTFMDRMMGVDTAQKYPLLDDHALRVKASQFTNDAFGGLNWKRLAEEAETKMGHAVASGAFSKKGRDAMQLGLFAPDWTLANIRIIGKGVPGISKNDKLLREAHRMYAYKGLLYFLAGQEGLNQMLHGEHYPGFAALSDALQITDNAYNWDKGEAEHYKDLYYLNIGGGDYMQLTKQLIEPPKWVFSPRVELINKAGIIPKLIAEVSTGSTYINPYDVTRSPRIYTQKEVDNGNWAATEYGKYLLGKMSPIAAGQLVSWDPVRGAYFDPARGISGASGFPIYRGKKYED